MIRRTVLAAFMAVAFAAPGFAGHCPKDAAAVDHALAVLKVDDAVKAQVMALRDKGLGEHEAGDHAASEDTLSEAMRTLLMSVK